jgi:hypothetical protein
MKLRHLFTVNIIIAAFFGLGCAIFPELIYWLYGIVPDEAAIWSARLVGGSILGFATLMWFGMRTASVEARRAIALALLLQDAVSFIASLFFQLTGKVNLFGWFSLALYCALALAYAYFLVLRPQAA